MAPVLVLVLVFVVFLGRVAQAEAKVHHAADQAARAASMVSRARSASVAGTTATDELSADGLACASVAVTTSVTAAAGLSAVEVHVTCTVESDDLAPLMPGRRSIVASSTEVIDVIRAVEP